MGYSVSRTQAEEHDQLSKDKNRSYHKAVSHIIGTLMPQSPINSLFHATTKIQCFNKTVRKSAPLCLSGFLAPAWLPPDSICHCHQCPVPSLQAQMNCFQTKDYRKMPSLPPLLHSIHVCNKVMWGILAGCLLDAKLYPEQILSPFVILEWWMEATWSADCPP